MIRVLVADDQPLVRSGLRMILTDVPDIAVVGEVADGGAAVARAARQDIDVVLMDVRMPLLDGIEATRRIAAAGTARVLVLTTFDLDEIVFDALRSGASGFLTKDVPEQRLVEAIRLVHEGGSLFAPNATRRLIATFASIPSRPARDLPLTDRELEVLRSVARGRSNAEIGRALFVTENTVKTHIARILAKLGARDRIQLVIWAYEAGLIERDTSFPPSNSGQ